MREKEKSTRIILVRHGKPDFPNDRLYCDDREDPCLTEEGKKQAVGAATMLSIIESNIDRVYVSPMQRARQTAAPIIEACGVPLSIEPDLKERPFGVWDGLYFNAIERDYPEQYRAWKQDPVMFVPEGGEPINTHCDRIRGAIQRIIGRHPGETIVVVAHVGPIRMCITEALRMPLESYRRLTVDYASLTRIDYGRRQDNLVYMNLYDRGR